MKCDWLPPLAQSSPGGVLWLRMAWCWPLGLTCFPNRSAIMNSAATAHNSPVSIRIGVGYVIHGIMFQHTDGAKSGRVYRNDYSTVPLQDEHALQERAPHTITLAPGEFLTEIRGFDSLMGYICHSISFITNQGQHDVQGQELPQRGPFFALAAPRGYYIAEIGSNNGKVQWIRAVVQPGQPPLPPLVISRWEA
jgi:hypothetical protein